MGILGLGKTGLSVVRALEQAGALLTCWDDDKEKRVNLEVEGVNVKDLNNKKLLRELDLLIVSPGIAHLYPKPHAIVRLAYELNVKIDNDIHVQVDTIITFPRYSSSENTESQWMPARWTPERGLKGYTIGNLYTALGNYFNMSIGDRGVTAKVRDGKRVSSRIRKGAVLKTISTNIQTFILDIAKEIAGENLTIGRSLSRNQGMNPQNIKIQDLALGIKALAETLEINGEISSSSNMISEILNLYQAGLKKNTDSKLSRGLDQKSYEKLLKLNEKVYNIVKSEMES